MIEARGTVVVHAPVDLCFDDWRHLNRLTQWMTFVDAVTSTHQPGVWHWQVTHPAGFTVDWDTEVTLSVTNTQLIWQPFVSPFHLPLGISGNVLFQMLDNYTTQIKLKLGFETNTDLALCWAQVLAAPDKAVNIALSKFKNRAELRMLRPLMEAQP